MSGSRHESVGQVTAGPSSHSGCHGTKPKSRCIVHVPGLVYGPLVQLWANADSDARLARMKEIRDKRLAEPLESAHRMTVTCECIPDTITEGDGYHRECYQRFTMNLKRLEQKPELLAASSRQSQRASTGDKVLFTPDCIFCNSITRKKVKKKGIWTTEGLKEFECDGWRTVLNVAEQKFDENLLRRIRGKDLFATEAKYHKSCRVQYTQNLEKWRSASTENKAKQIQLVEAHSEAFGAVSRVIDKEIIGSNKMMKLTDLTKIYIAHLECTNFPNPKFRGEKLKAKLETHGQYKEKVAFCKLNKKGSFSTYIVYNSQSDITNLVQCAYELGSKDMIQETGHYLHEEILESFAKADELRWPPSAQDLVSMNIVIPSNLETFLCHVICGKPKSQSSKMNRLVNSIGQDICRATTNGEWKLPKHMLICMTLRHLFRSEKLITLFNRLGHSEKYTFSLELETALAEAVAETSSLLSTQIIRSPGAPSIFHSEFDNFDQLLNNLTGMDSIHTAHGIMLQDIEGKPEDHGGVRIDIPSTSRKTKRRSFEQESAEALPDCYITQRKSPQITIHQRVIPDGERALQDATMKHFLWVLIRTACSKSDQQFPGWTGFITMTGRTPESLTTIDYYPVIPSPITDYKTVKECLRYAEEATAEIQQQYLVTTFDLGVCMKAYPLIWNDQSRYDKHIILIGTFHLACAYLKMVGKKMDGSGLSDILLEAGLIASGSLQGVLTGKHYDRSLHCHKTVLECLERLLLSQYLTSIGEKEVFSQLPEGSKGILDELLKAPSKEAFDATRNDAPLQKYIEGYQQFRESVQAGHLGKTAQLWTSYMDHIWLVLSLIHAVKHNDFLLYAQCLHLMADLFFSFGGQNYARYLSYFSIFIANIEVSHPGATELLKRGAISVARSFIPGNRCAVDKTMEETFMRHAKSHGGAGGNAFGVSGILTNYDAYQRWVRTTHARSQYVNATLSMADMLSGTAAETKHHELRPAEMLKSEKLVRKTIEAVESFLNPFELGSTDNLFILSSGAAVSAEVQRDVLRAEQAGKVAKDVFIATRLEKGCDFFEPIKRLGLKTFANMNKKSKVTTTTHKVIQYQQQGNVAFQLFMKSQQQGLQLDMRELLTYPLTPVPYSIGTADGFLSKTDKSKSFAYLVKDINDAALPATDQTLVIIDGNAYFYFLKELPGNFKQICSKVFDMMPKTGNVVFSTDSYFPNSVKTMERQRRGCGQKLIIKGENTKRPADWKQFLANDENKQQFIALLTRLWSEDAYARKLHGRQVIITCEGTAYLLTSEDGSSTCRTEVLSLKSTQEETDSRVILYCDFARDNNYSNVVVKSPDTDIFFILLHYALAMSDLNIMFHTGTGNKKRLIDVSEMSRSYSQQHLTALMALHAFSGCDTTSAFKGLGKVRPLKTLSRMPKFGETLARLGDTWDVPRDLVDLLNEFTCALFSRPRVRSVDELRFLRMSELCSKDDKHLAHSRNVDLATLPPCGRSLEQHIRRVNYQVGIWKVAHIANPDIPDACNGHGWTLVDQKIEPLWYEGCVLPQQLADIIESVSGRDEEDESDDDSVSDEQYLSDDDNSESDQD